VRHALLVPLPEVEDVTVPWLEHSIGARPSHGVPPHVTLLFPCPGEPERIREVLAGAPAFDVAFRQVRRFETSNALWLAPEPSEPFERLTRALWTRFPDWPPFGGEFLPEIMPHLTLAWGAKLDEAEEAVVPTLPLRARAQEAVLLAEVGPQRWEPRARFPFRGA
jgi:2'-5' RNA ligase